MLTCLEVRPKIMPRCSNTSRKSAELHKKRAALMGAALTGSAFEGVIQVLVYLFEEAHCGQPTLIGANQQRQILGHEA
jgi:hypothetical protein